MVVEEICGEHVAKKEKHKLKTKIMPQTLFPQWNEVLKFPVPRVEQWSARVSLWDHNFGTNQPMGHIDIKGTAENVSSLWVDVVDGKGRIRLGHSVVSAAIAAAEKEVHRFQAQNPAVSLVSPRAREKMPNSGYVRLWIYSGQDLMAKDKSGTSDPYAVVVDLKDMHGRKMQTAVKPKTLMPVWDEFFVFLVPDMKQWTVRIDLFDKDLIGSDFLGYCDVPGSAEKVPRLELPVKEGSGSIAVGWVVAKDPPIEEDDLEEASAAQTMPLDRQGRLRVHVKSASELGRRDGPVQQLNALVRIVDGAPEASITTAVYGVDQHYEWKNDWLEIDLPDLASWNLSLEVLERIDGRADQVLGTVALHADKFDIGGSVDYKTLPINGALGELTVGIQAAKSSKRLARDIQRVKASIQAEEIRKARVRAQMLVQLLGSENANAGDIALRICDCTLGPSLGDVKSIYAEVEGLLATNRSRMRTKTARGPAFAWDESATLHVPDLANFSFDIVLWEPAALLGKSHRRGSVNVGSLDLMQLGAQDGLNALALTVKFGENQEHKIRLEVTPLGTTVDVMRRLVTELEAERSSPPAWPEKRMGVLRLHVVRAKELAVADLNGKSDPYVRVAHHFDTHGEVVKTETIMRTLNPWWDEWFDIPVEDLAQVDMTIGVWDYDVGMDDTLGYVPLRSEDLDFSDAEQQKTVRVINGEGSVTIGIAPTIGSLSLFRKIRAAKEAGLAPRSLSGLPDRVVVMKNGGVVQLHIAAARGLLPMDRGGTSDPYAMVSRAFLTGLDGKPIKTRVIKKTLAPNWDEYFEFWVPNVLDFHFQVSLWDWDFGRHDPLGYVRIDSRDWLQYIAKGQEHRWLKIEDEGEINIGLIATPSALMVLERVQKERQEKIEADRVAREAEIHRREIMETVRERLKLLRELKPLYPVRKKDPMTPLAILLIIVLILHLVGVSIWSLVGRRVVSKW